MSATFRRREFKCSNWGCLCEEPTAFGKPRWRNKLGLVFLSLHRIIWLIFFIIGIVLAISITDEELILQSFAFLTIWTFLITTLSMFITSLATILINTCYIGKKMNCLLGLVWVIHNMAALGSFITTIIFWTLMTEYTPGPAMDGDTRQTLLIAGEVITHGMGTLYFFIDLWVGKFPVRFTHFYHGLLYLLIYLIFIIIYATNGGKYIYYFIDFKTSPRYSTLMTFVVFLIAMASWTVYYGAYLLATYVEYRVYKTRVGPFGDSDDETPIQSDPEVQKTEM